MRRRFRALPALLLLAACGGRGRRQLRTGGASGRAYGGIPDLSGRTVLVFPAAVGAGWAFSWRIRRSGSPSRSGGGGSGGSSRRSSSGPWPARRGVAGDPGAALRRGLPPGGGAGGWGDPPLRGTPPERRSGGGRDGPHPGGGAATGRGETEAEGYAEIAAALVDVRSGRVHWFGRVAGECRKPQGPGGSWLRRRWHWWSGFRPEGVVMHKRGPQAWDEGNGAGCPPRPLG